MLGRTNTGGGGGLNFKVVGGTTAPSNPKENMIWVNTSTKITSYIFSATQPTAESGMVWFSTSTSSPVEFNALKKNGIQVYPISAKQYVSGAFVDKPIKVYQNGVWSQVEINFFKNGTIKDGYVTVGNVNIGTNAINVTIEDKVSSYVIHGPISLNGRSYITMKYNYVRGTADTKYFFPTVFVARGNNISHGTDAIAYARNKFNTGNNQEVKLDISGRNDLDNVYVYYGIDNTDDSYERKIAITEVVCI